MSKFELPETLFDKMSGTKSPVKPTCSKKIAVLSTFFKYLLNILFNNLKKNSSKFGTVREKSGVKR